MRPYRLKYAQAIFLLLTIFEDRHGFVASHFSLEIVGLNEMMMHSGLLLL